jgi:hypothetical protein
MSADVSLATTIGDEKVRSEIRTAPPAIGWTPERFAREQIRKLVRNVFLANVERPVRQVVFTALDRETDLRAICRQVGEALSLETTSSIGVVGDYPQSVMEEHSDGENEGSCVLLGEDSALRQNAIRMRANLWLLPAPGRYEDYVAAQSLHAYLSQVRRQFGYSIVEGPFWGESNNAASMAQFADGIILIVSAHRTRRMVARRMKETLEAARVRVLGTILSNRVFPIPEAIYRRL